MNRINTKRSRSANHVLVLPLYKFAQIKNTHTVKFILLLLLASTATISASANAAERVYQLALTAPVASAQGVELGQVFFSSTAASSIDTGEQYEVMLPTGGSVNATVIENSGSQPVPGASGNFISVSDDAKVLQLDNSAGSLELHLVGNTIAGLTLHDVNNGKFFRAQLDGNGNGTLVEVDADKMLCNFMPKESFSTPTPPNVENIPAGLTLDTVQNLESRPGATHTIFINSWGGVLTDTAWNQFNDGLAIEYTPYSFDSDTTTFSADDIDNIWLGWAEMAEDYAEFDVNITTKASVYNATPAVDRSQIIDTTSCSWYQNCRYGGVAYLGIFNNTSEYFKTGWTWNRGFGSHGMTHSHEAGHQLGLSHDGTSSLEYYRGHGEWGPIMGAPFGKRYVQWSIGSYNDANNFEDDLNVLSNVLGVRPDDVGNSVSNPNELRATDGENLMITQGGFGQDVDIFEFTLSSPQNVSINVQPLLGYEMVDRAANVAITSRLEDSRGNTLAGMTSADNTPLRPDTNSLDISMTLPADTYYFGLRGASPNTDWSTGFDEYGNGGQYRLVVDINPEITTPVPSTTLSGSTETFTWIDHGNDITNYWVNIGSNVNGNQYLAGISLGADANSVTATSLPVDGRTVYMRLWWRLASGAWEYTDYTYAAANSDGPTITTPAPDSTVFGTSVNFQWDAGASDVTQWWLYAGTTSGARDIYNSRSLDTALSDDVPMPANNSAVYVTLWFKIDGVWASSVYRYVSAP